MDKDLNYFYRCDFRYETSYGVFVGVTLEASEFSVILENLEFLNELYSIIDVSIVCLEALPCPAENM